MARSQGLNRLLNGVSRELHKSETDRGYVFVTKDKALLDRCNYSLDVTFNDKRLGTEKIDNYGRIFPKKELRHTLMRARKIHLELQDDAENLYIKVS